MSHRLISSIVLTMMGVGLGFHLTSPFLSLGITTVFCCCFFLLQHDFLSTVTNADEMISQLIQRTQKAVEELDNQNYRHQKMLLSGAGLEEAIRDDDIESEPPRYLSLHFSCSSLPLPSPSTPLTFLSNLHIKKKKTP